MEPILTYVSETRAETSETKQLTRSTKMKSLRTINRVTLRDKIRSNSITEELKEDDVVRWIRSRRRQWRMMKSHSGPKSRYRRVKVLQVIRLRGGTKDRRQDHLQSILRHRKSTTQRTNCPRSSKNVRMHDVKNYIYHDFCH